MQDLTRQLAAVSASTDLLDEVLGVMRDGDEGVAVGMLARIRMGWGPGRVLEEVRAFVFPLSYSFLRPLLSLSGAVRRESDATLMEMESCLADSTNV